MSEQRRPDNIPGYQHPTNYSYSKRGVYKTFTPGEKPKGKEIFGNTATYSQYTKYGDYEDEDTELCPTCNTPPVQVCQCGYSDKTCASGHKWYTDRNGKIKKGNPHTTGHSVCM